MKALAALLWLFPMSFFVLASPPPQEFVITADSMWAVEASANGRFTVDGERVSVLFKSITLSRHRREGVYNGDVFVEGVQVGLATDGPGGWEVKRWGGMLHVNKPIGVDQMMSFSDFSAAIAVDGIEDLSNYWFVLKVETTILEEQHGTTYSHSTNGLFAR